jgi:hypothetical protein
VAGPGLILAKEFVCELGVVVFVSTEEASSGGRLVCTGCILATVSGCSVAVDIAPSDHNCSSSIEGDSACRQS